MNTLKCRKCGQPLCFDPSKSVYMCENCQNPRLRPLPSAKYSSTSNKKDADNVQTDSDDIRNSLSKIFDSLQSGLFLRADILCDGVLKRDPDNAHAHIGKVLAAFKCHNTAALAVCDPAFGQNSSFKEALRCAAPEVREELRGYLQAAVDLQSVKTGSHPAVLPAEKPTGSAAAPSAFKRLYGGILKNKYAKYYIGAALLLTVVPSGMLLGNPLSHDRDYRAAKQYMKSGNYEQAGLTFTSLDGYRDSRDLAVLCRYEYGKQLQDARQFCKAKLQYDSVISYRDSAQRSADCAEKIDELYKASLRLMQAQEWQKAKYKLEDISGFLDSQQLIKKCDGCLLLQKIGELPVGRVFALGSYVYENGGQPQPIKWRVLSSTAQDVLAVSMRGLDYLPYSDSAQGQTWRYSALRRWLNGEFLQEAFSDTERLCLADAHLVTAPNPQFKTPGSDTWDKVFVLSADEAQRYFRDDADRVCQATDYANQLSDWQYPDQTNWWWLRSPGRSLRHAAVVSQEGSIDYLSYNETANKGMVRPAVRLKRLPASKNRRKN